MNNEKPSIILTLILTLSCLIIPKHGIAGSMKQPASLSEECVVLLHGLARTDRSMQKMANALAATGYRVFNLHYPSREKSIEQLAMEIIPDGIRRCKEAGKNRINFVTHSMSGIILRFYLSKKSIPELGRVVMLSPPNQGSELADSLMDNPLYIWINGPAGQQLGIGPDGITAGLGPVDFSLGIITGNKHSFIDRWFSDLIPGDDDGKVSVERVKVEGMSDFLVLPYTHTYIMDENEVISQTIYFLQKGIFKRDDISP